MTNQAESGFYAKEKVGGEAGDALGEALIAAGFVPNEFILGLNRAVRVSAGFELSGQWALPSRVFQFPIETHAPAGDRARTIGLLNPLLAEHPFVKHFEQVMGFEVPRERACNAHGYSVAAGSTWWHAVDLAGAGLWDELLQTRQFTTELDIFRAIGFSLRFAQKDEPLMQRLMAVRRVMRELDSPQPADLTAVIRSLMAPSSTSDHNGKTRWPINEISRDPETTAWAFILGVELGWFEFRGRFLNWSAAGRHCYEAGDAMAVENGAQVSFSF